MSNSRSDYESWRLQALSEKETFMLHKNFLDAKRYWNKFKIYIEKQYRSYLKNLGDGIIIHNCTLSA